MPIIIIMLQQQQKQQQICTARFFVCNFLFCFCQPLQQTQETTSKQKKKGSEAKQSERGVGEGERG